MNKKNLFIVSAFVAALALAGTAKAQDICTAPVKTETGMIKGLSEKNHKTCVWRGIPYAAPPVGELRWKAPAPAKAWEGVRDGSVWGAHCLQKGEMNYVNFDPSGKASEDCLYLNVWRPNKPGKFPVMFWIHGGGYAGGVGDMPTYWGDRMSQGGDVVVVTINYRLNVFGFLALPGLRSEDPNKSTGSYGSLDQIAALKWVQNNIANFGGDPDNVTIFGESAGGWSVCTMLATPLAKGLFDHAIMESGGCEASVTLEEGYAAGKAIADKLGCRQDDLDCLRRLPAKKVLSTSYGSLATGFSLLPSIDNYILTDTPLAMIQSGNFNNVPFMAGTNLNEANLVLALDSKLGKVKPEGYQAELAKYFNISAAEADQLAKLYPLGSFDNSPKKAIGQMTTDIIFTGPTYQGLSAASKNQKSIYLYRFDWHNTSLGKTTGAVHSMELSFVFNSMDRKPWSMLMKNHGSYVEEMETLSQKVQGYWVGFARKGNPNGSNIVDWAGKKSGAVSAGPEWKTFSPDSPYLMVLDKNVRSETVSKEVQNRSAFWADYNKKHGQFVKTMGKPKK
jgi:para-nitrobenzyl esterase